jgi:hypothetical protein
MGLRPPLQPASGRNMLASRGMAPSARAATVLLARALVAGAALSSFVAGAAERPALTVECRMRTNMPIRLAATSGPVEISQPESSVALAAVPDIEPAYLSALPTEAQLFLVLHGLRAEAVGVLYTLYVGGGDGALGEAQYLDAFNFFDLTIPTLSLDVTGKRGLVLERLRGRTFPLVIVARSAAGTAQPRATVEAIELVAQCGAG